MWRRDNRRCGAAIPYGAASRFVAGLFRSYAGGKQIFRQSRINGFLSGPGRLANGSP